MNPVTEKLHNVWTSDEVSHLFDILSGPNTEIANDIEKVSAALAEKTGKVRTPAAIDSQVRKQNWNPPDTFWTSSYQARKKQEKKSEGTKTSTPIKHPAPHYVKVARAAKLAKRSRSWIENLSRSGAINRHRDPRSGLYMYCVSDIIDLFSAENTLARPARPVRPVRPVHRSTPAALPNEAHNLMQTLRWLLDGLKLKVLSTETLIQQLEIITR